MSQQNWNTQLYDNQHGFVWQYGESLVELLAPQAGELIVDLGCGTGHLTEKIAQTGSNVFGIDADFQMIQAAQKTYPHLHFEVADASNFQVQEPLDGVFSNAVLHWIKEPDAVIASVYQALKIGGRFVAEFGGKGNIQLIMEAFINALENRGYDHEQNPWYYPSISDYTMRLENHGFEVIYARLFDRPTLLEGKESGMANWLRMFRNGVLSQFSLQEQSEIIQAVEESLKDKLYQNGQWTADYRRIRIVAYK